MTKAKILPLLDFVPALSPRFTKPSHLAPVSLLFERSLTEPVRAVVAAPARHGKTELEGHGIVWLLKQKPWLQIALGMHSQRIGERKASHILDLCRRAGVPLEKDQSRSHIRTGVEGGGLLVISPDTGVAGDGFHHIFLDDIVRNRAHAESSAAREKLREWLVSDVIPRGEPDASTWLFEHRYHPDDISSTAMALPGWTSVSLPAIDDKGHALWPERWPVEKLRELEAMVGAYVWESIYQQRPLPRSGQRFKDVYFVDTLPSLLKLKIVIGVDLAYSSKTSADHSVAVVLGVDEQGRAYVLDVVRMQVEAPKFLPVLQALQARHPGAPFVMFSGGGGEKGALDFMRDQGVLIEAKPAVADKFTRSLSSQAAWNRGAIMVPRTAPWLDPFINEVLNFQGTRADRHDDQVDALAAAVERAAIFAPPEVIARAIAPEKPVEFIHAHRPWLSIVRPPLGGLAYLVAQQVTLRSEASQAEMRSWAAERLRHENCKVPPELEDPANPLGDVWADATGVLVACAHKQWHPCPERFLPRTAMRVAIVDALAGLTHAVVSELAEIAGEARATADLAGDGWEHRSLSAMFGRRGLTLHDVRAEAGTDEMRARLTMLLHDRGAILPAHDALIEQLTTWQRNGSPPYDQAPVFVQLLLVACAATLSKKINTGSPFAPPPSTMWIGEPGVFDGDSLRIG